MLGAFLLQDVAAKQETELKAKNYNFINQEADELINMYRNLLINIGNFLEIRHKQDRLNQKAKLTRDELVKMTEKVKKYIEDYEDQIALEQLEVIAEYQMEDFTMEIIRKAIAALRLYDYDEVVNILQKLES